MAGRALGDGPDADIAIMMVEAGGTEKAWSTTRGAPKVTEEVIAGGLEAAKTWIRESIELQRELVEKAGRKETIPFELFVDYGDDVYERVVAVGGDRSPRPTPSRPKPSATPPSTRPPTRSWPSCAASSPGASGRSRPQCGR